MLNLFILILNIPVDYGFEFGIAFTDAYGRPLVLDPRYFTLDISQTTTYKSGDTYLIILYMFL